MRGAETANVGDLYLLKHIPYPALKRRRDPEESPTATNDSRIGAGVDRDGDSSSLPTSRPNHACCPQAPTDGRAGIVVDHGMAETTMVSRCSPPGERNTTDGIPTVEAVRVFEETKPQMASPHAHHHIQQPRTLGQLASTHVVTIAEELSAAGAAAQMVAEYA